MIDRYTVKWFALVIGGLFVATFVYVLLKPFPHWDWGVGSMISFFVGRYVERRSPSQEKV